MKRKTVSAKGRWIPVTKKLPDGSLPVLVAVYLHGHFAVTIACYRLRRARTCFRRSGWYKETPFQEPLGYPVHYWCGPEILDGLKPIRRLRNANK